MGIPKLPKLGLLQLWGPITSRADLQLRWGIKQSFSPCWELFSGMSHVTCTQVNWVDSWLLVVGSQIGNLTLGLSFGHNLCFRCPNGWCKLILDIYVSIVFQWYKELFNPLGFDYCNCSLNIWESIGTPTPKVGVPLGVWRPISSHFLALMGACGMTPRLPSWLTTLQPFALVISLRLGLRHNISKWLWMQVLHIGLGYFKVTLHVGIAFRVDSSFKLAIHAFIVTSTIWNFGASL